MNLFLLYIDPGTGSMLFSILIGVVATLYFLGKAAFIKLKFILTGKSAKGDTARYPYVIYCEGRQYWNVFKPVTDEFEKRGVDVVYFTSAEDDPVFEQNYQHIKSEYIGAGNTAFARLNLLEADVVLMTTPGLDVYQLKRSKRVKHYSHVLHAPSDATLYRLFGLDYFNSVLLTGDFQAPDIRLLEQQRNLPEKELVTVGCSYLDVYKEKIGQLTPETVHQFTVLVSPSWGTSGILNRFGEKLLDPLVKTGWRIIVRPHPQSKKSEAPMLERLTERYKDAENLEWDYANDNIYSLSKADIMISDFSGIVYDYIFLFNKPVIYVKAQFDLRPYDAYDLGHPLWQYETLEKIGVELREEEFDRIGEVIKSAGASTGLADARREAKEAAWQHPGEAGKRIADFMIQKYEDSN
ncbi:CDP-glycerol glycerophosphotransferase family protein [Breznakiella homolactica]|uniref:CDP-glycerol glycerophosphotransferase family protein n=1 Tax=Breznakiella homolactica TaxID=2798577 RepID=A0A7T7XNU6_9SPIR|nr:CDP-glycerol glycerophosphotransferase family protein [Breznakiella homolactica]QQO09795.1 CDP-glycerol glycerophosphotransferase family protein [Breznakiella homolactica]